ncbi:MAG: hypothetical protein C0402_14580, partial [Thermodesulfovibrio sp.]|nr:hypothetical protein [Thermodesulfovibrio sp.]
MGNRRSERKAVKFNTKIILAGKAYDGYITNVSQDGIGCSITSVLKAPKDFMPIKIPELQFELPSGETVNLTCELAWFTGTEQDDHQLTLGLKILTPSPHYHEFIKELFTTSPDKELALPPAPRKEAGLADDLLTATAGRINAPPANSSDACRTIVESVEDSIYIVDTLCRYQFMNPEHLSRLSIKGDGYLGRPYRDFHSEDEAEELENRIAEVITSGKPVTYEHQSRRENKYFVRTLSPLKGPEGTAIAIAVVSKNITDRRLAEELLLKSNQQLEKLVEERTTTLMTLNENLQQEISGHKQTEDALKLASDDWRITFDSTRDMMLMLDRDFKIIKSNRAITQFFSRSYYLIIGQSFFDLFTDMDIPAENHPLKKMQQSKKHEEAEIYLKDSDIWVLMSVDPVLNNTTGIAGAVLNIRDITEQKNLLTQLLQAQKMESIGRLAGGVAHDFNNILSSIIGYTELALMKIPDNSPIRNYLVTVKESGEKAAALTRRLLAFSRKQVLQMQSVNLNKTIEGITLMMKRLIREDILLELHLDPSLQPVMADPLQLEQIFMNLIINARDAMPEGGKLIIETGNIHLDNDFTIRHENVRTGEYVLLSVSDTGIGMNKQVQGKIFEPFFTTKPVGEGTGLGLSTVYGIVAQHNGYIYIYSEPGKGTTIKIYLPVSSGQSTGEGQKNPLPLAHGKETVLVVDDDPSIRRLLKDILIPLGYRLLVAHDGEEALKLAEQADPPVDLLLTDV